MESEDGGPYPKGSPEQELMAEREAIMRQLAELGEDLDGDDNDESCNVEPEPIEGSDESGTSGNSGDASPVEDVEFKEVKKEASLDPARPPVKVTKVVLERVDEDETLPLPEGWMIIVHHSGMPVYYHKFTRVVTHSKPYQSEGVIRDHRIPICSIPCLYRERMNDKLKAEEASELKVKKEITEEAEGCPVEKKDAVTVKTETISPDEYREYCERRFKFKQITVTRYSRPEHRAEAAQEKRANSLLKKAGFELDYDHLKKGNGSGEILLTSAAGVTFIDLTYMDSKRRGGSKKPYLMNPMGKTSIAVLNEFIQRLVKGALTYLIDDTRNVTCPYQATASLTIKTSQLEELAGQCKESLTVLSEIAMMSDGSVDPDVPPDCKRFAVGRGVGSNKKTARLVAATDALAKLIPKLRVNQQHVCDGVQQEANKKGFEEESRELFKKVKVDTQNLVEMCARFAIPKPYALLRDAVTRSLRWNGMELKTSKELVGAGHQMSKVTLTLGTMSQTAEAIGVKQATQFASQLLLKEMHPEVLTYGGFLEMYGRFEDKEKLDYAKKQHDEVVRLQDTGNLLKPNFIVLSKLAEEMSQVTLVHPPRKFLFGLAPNEANVSKTTRSVQSQYQVEDILPPRAVPHYGAQSLPPEPNFPMTRGPEFQCYPPQFPILAPQYHHQHPPHQQPYQQQQRKRLRPPSPPGNFPPRGPYPPPYDQF